jgi:hypothetical protein
MTHGIRRIARSYINVALCISLLLTPLSYATAGGGSFSSPIPEDIRNNTHSVAIIPAGFTPTTNLLTYARGKGTGIAKGAAQGTLQATLQSLRVGGQGCLELIVRSGGAWEALVLCVPFLAIVATGAIVGVYGGGKTAIPAEDVTKIETYINKVLRELDMQNTMAGSMFSKGIELTRYQFVLLKGPGSSSPDGKPDLTLIKRQGYDIAMEVGVLEIGFSGGSGEDPSMRFYMDARIRAFRANDGAELYADTFGYNSQEGKFSEWAKNGGLKLKEALESGYAEIAEAAIEVMFLLYEGKIESIWSTQTHCMLKPLYPPQVGFGPRNLPEFSFPKVNTPLPNFKWESFPRDKDRETDSMGILKRVSDITYELKVWRGKDGVPEELIYSRSGLPIAEHTIGTALQPGIEYFWTVRAHFKLDGQKRRTKWAHSRTPWGKVGGDRNVHFDPCREIIIPLNNYHRFKITLK